MGDGDVEITQSTKDFVNTMYQFEDVYPHIFENRTREELETAIQLLLSIGTVLTDIINNEAEIFVEQIKLLLDNE